MAIKNWKPPQFRHRERGSATGTSTAYENKNRLGVITDSGTLAGRTEYNQLESFNDFSIPGYKARSSKGEVFNQPMNANVCRSVTPKGQWQFNYIDGPGLGTNKYTGSDLWFFSVPYSGNPNWSFGPGGARFFESEVPGLDSDQKLIDLAAIQAKANVVKADAQALVMIAELNKVVDMLAQSSTRAANGLRLLLQGRPKQAILKTLGYTRRTGSSAFRASSKTAAARWLEIQYGWLPLIYDVQGALKALGTVQKPRFTARGFANTSKALITTGSSNYFGISGLAINWALNQNLEKRVRAFILYEVDARSFISQKLGLLQLPGSAWELVPWSFVVDWFVNIGSWLDALTPRVGVNVLAEGYTLTTQHDRVRSVVSTTFTSPYSNESGLTGTSDQWFGRSKVRMVGLPAFPLPRVNVKFNPKRAIDALALLVQLAKKL
jgi:hypothetical protein